MVDLKGLMMILELHRQGLSVSAIAERTGHDRKTVRKYIHQGLVTPKYKPRTPRPTVIQFLERRQCVHLLGPPGTGKSHLAIALGVEAVKAGKSVYFATLAELVDSMRKAEREGKLRDRVRFLGRYSLLIVRPSPTAPLGLGQRDAVVNVRPARD